MCVGVARVGTPTQAIAAAPLSGMVHCAMGMPLQSLIIVGHTHPLEDKMLSVVANTVLSNATDNKTSSDKISLYS